MSAALWGHLDAPDFRGVLIGATSDALAVNPLCGDEVRLQWQMDEAGCVEAARFTGRGCRVSQAAASLMCERIEGLGREELEALRPQDVLSWCGVSLSPVRQTCALTAYEALKKAWPAKPGKVSANQATDRRRDRADAASESNDGEELGWASTGS